MGYINQKQTRPQDKPIPFNLIPKGIKFVIEKKLSMFFNKK